MYEALNFSDHVQCDVCVVMSVWQLNVNFRSTERSMIPLCIFSRLQLFKLLKMH
jgi:hypothetical protein